MVSSRGSGRSVLNLTIYHLRFTIYRYELWLTFFPDKVRNTREWEKIWLRIFPSLRGSLKNWTMRLHFSVSRLCFEGSPEDLQLTENTQPAILAVSVAILRTLESEGFPVPDFVAGHSLGEYSALVGGASLSRD